MRDAPETISRCSEVPEYVRTLDRKLYIFTYSSVHIHTNVALMWTHLSMAIVLNDHGSPCCPFLEPEFLCCPLSATHIYCSCFVSRQHYNLTNKPASGHVHAQFVINYVCDIHGSSNRQSVDVHVRAKNSQHLHRNMFMYIPTPGAWECVQQPLIVFKA